MDPLLLRGIERLVIVIGAIFIAFLGYRLFIHGKEKGKGNISVDSEVLKILVSGQGPGLFFMAFGSIVLCLAVLNGGASKHTLKKMPEMDEKLGKALSELSQSDLELRRSLQIFTAETDKNIDKIEELVEYSVMKVQSVGSNSNYDGQFLMYFQEISERLKKIEELTEVSIRKSKENTSNEQPE